MLVSSILIVLPLITGAQSLIDSLSDLFEGQLGTDYRTFDPRSGTQDFEQCCIHAVKQSLEIVNGEAQFAPGQTVLQGNITSFLQRQFPCDARYNGGPGDPQQVIVSYSWCETNCDGWEKAKASPAALWLEPLLAFILPVVVFCFAIPRRHNIVVPDSLFPHNRLLAFPGNLAILYKLPITALLLTVDSIGWVVVVIVFAGPMILSGFLETYLDNQIVVYLDRCPEVSLRERAALLLVALIGNLDYDDVDVLADSILDGVRPNSGPRLYILRTRLQSILKAQPAFGATIGIGVLFYMASYLYSLREIQNNLGVNYTSHALAFGVFWMVVGHVSIVAGMPLSSNNPNTFEGVSVSGQTEATHLAVSQRHWTHDNELSAQRPVWKKVAHWPATFSKFFYGSRTMSNLLTAWMWNRGISKLVWLDRMSRQSSRQKDFRRSILRISTLDWLVSIILPTMCLTLVPAFLGGMLSYLTPAVGLACRSSVALMYLIAQLLLILLWLINWWMTTLQAVGKIGPDLSFKRRGPTLFTISWYAAFAVGVAASVVAAIGGTAFQVMGLFKNCLCYTSMRFWSRRYDPSVTLTLGLNSEEQVYNAGRYWVPIGLSAMVFLLVTAGSCWRYQRSLRQRFLDMTEMLR